MPSIGGACMNGDADQFVFCGIVVATLRSAAVVVVSGGFVASGVTSAHGSSLPDACCILVHGSGEYSGSVSRSGADQYLTGTEAHVGQRPPDVRNWWC